MKNKAKTEASSNPFNTILTKNEWNQVDMEMKSAIKKHEKKAEDFLRKNPNYKPKAPAEKPMTY